MQNDGTLILGASGLVGGYLFDFLKYKNKKVIGTYCNNKKEDLVYFDITKLSINDISLKEINYAVICSAITKLDKCKENPGYSNEVNVNGLKKIIRDLDKKNIVPIFMSSAAVFDGKKGGYKEEDKKNPLNLYGRQKTEIEDFILSNIKDYLILRPGKVFGLKKGEGGLFADWLWKYRNKEEILCVDDEEVSPHYVQDVARGIELLIGTNKRGIYNINSLEHYDRYSLAKNFFEHARIKDVKIKRCSMEDLGLKEERAKKPYLDSFKFIKETGFRFTKLEDCYDLIKKINI